MKYSHYLLLLILFGTSISAQNYPTKDFVPPMHIPLYLAGVFGECRPTHFHAGMDIKTNQVEGLPVFSIGDGYVSRIKVSAFGYGNALYITHTNGYTSVYGHLQSFRADIAAYVKQKQYEKETYEIDLELAPNTIICKKDEQVAKSGNTGGSSGPHLHFEIRDKEENALNPQLFGIKIIDNIAPSISGVAIYNEDMDRFATVPIILNTKLKGTYFAPIKDTILLNSDAIAFGVEAIDRMNNSAGNNGLYEIQVKIDGQELYHFTMNKFHFDETRNVLAYIDQKIKSVFSRNFQRCHVLPNQYFTPQKNNSINRGIYTIKDEAYHLVSIVVKDFQQNSSEAKFYVRKDYTTTVFKRLKYTNQTAFYAAKKYDYKTGEARIIIPESALFDTTYVIIQNNSTSFCSEIYTIGKPIDAFMVPIEIGIKVKNVAPAYYNKCILVEKSSGKTVVCGGRYEEGYIIGKTKNFGVFSIAIDTTAPRVIPLNISANKVMNAETFIRISMSDNLSGIKDYDAYIDGKWVLFENSGNVLKYKFDLPISHSEHKLELHVKDERMNENVYEVRFIY